MGDDNAFHVHPLLTMEGFPLLLASLGMLSKPKRRSRLQDCVVLNLGLGEYEHGTFVAVPSYFRLIGKLGWPADPPPDPSAYVYELAQAFCRGFSRLSLPTAILTHLAEVAGSRHSLQNKGYTKNMTGETSWFVKRALNWNYQIWGQIWHTPTQMVHRDLLHTCSLDENQAQHLHDVLASITAPHKSMA